MRKKAIVLILGLIVKLSVGQQLSFPSIDSISQRDNKRYTYSSLIIPSVLIGYGAIGVKNKNLRIINSEIKEETQEHIDHQLTIDDFSQYSTFLSVYGFNAIGVKGKNNFRDRTIILTTSYLIMGTTVNALKFSTEVERPDGTSRLSFPSGHTATAFMGAEFLFQEYKDKSVWYGLIGYVVATGTGAFRIYNNRHWLTDVAAGAGIGILSTKMGYRLFPIISNRIFKRKDKKSFSLIMPFYYEQKVGVSLLLTL